MPLLLVSHPCAQWRHDETPDLPGDMIATVTEPVYDSATGRYLLIPQGSRILGRYNSQVSYGQSRVQVVWN